MATNYEKQFIGKGRKIDNLDIVKVTIPLDELTAIAYKYEDTGKMYVTFEVAKLKEADKFGRTHSCYYSRKIEPAAIEPAKPALKPRKPRKPVVAVVAEPEAF